MGTFDPLEYQWFAVVNDLIGGWAVSNVNKPSSQQDHRIGEVEIADFMTEEVARHVAETHNAWLAAR